MQSFICQLNIYFLLETKLPVCSVSVFLECVSVSMYLSAIYVSRCVYVRDADAL